MNNELYHYGVLGMKWGKRKGNVSDNSEKGKTKTNQSSKSIKDTTVSEIKKDKKKLSTGKKVALGVLAGVATLTIADIAMNKESWKNTAQSTKLAVGLAFMKK